jgi:hypothetical protein
MKIKACSLKDEVQKKRKATLIDAAFIGLIVT